MPDSLIIDDKDARTDCLGQAISLGTLSVAGYIALRYLCGGANRNTRWADMKISRSIRTGYLVKSLEILVRTHIEDKLHAIDITALQYTILSAIKSETGASTANLSRLFSVTRQSMREVLLTLEARGLIVRRADADDRRNLRVFLTVKGRALLRQGDALVDRAEGELFGDLTRTDLNRLRTILAALIVNLRGAD